MRGHRDNVEARLAFLEPTLSIQRAGLVLLAGIIAIGSAVPSLRATAGQHQSDPRRDLADGRNGLTLNIMDDYTRECVAIEVDRSLPGLRAE